jgi:crossover junction endodeoxyribonuclease RuvC
MNTRRILGVDPGTNELGFGLIEARGKKCILLDLGVIHMRHLRTPSAKLEAIFTNLTVLIDTHKPHEMAIEAPFYGKNIQSMLKLGRAQGVAIAAALQRKLKVVEYSPKKIKQSVTGNGNASKEQVAAMIKQTLVLPQTEFTLDATDAVATAICHFHQSNSLFGARKYKDWDSFILKNPGREL